MVELKTPGEIDAMHAAGQVVAQTLAAAKAHASVGVALSELDAVAADGIASAGAKPLFRGYRPDWAPMPFPATICVSVNDAVVHGIPGKQRLRDGDVVSIDGGARLDGWCGDAAVTFIVSEADPADVALLQATEDALAAAIAAARIGNTVRDVASAVAQVARSRGYGQTSGQGGHGIGREMHEEPSMPNVPSRWRGMRLRAGLVVALEPLLTRGSDDSYVDPDGWTVRTADGSRAAHSEHTVAITENGPRVLTA